MITCMSFMRMQSHSKLSFQDQRFCSKNTLMRSRSNISASIFEKGAKLWVFLGSPEHRAPPWRKSHIADKTQLSHMAIVPIIRNISTSVCVCYGFICRWSVFGAFSIFGDRSGSCVSVLSCWPTARFSKDDWNDPREEVDHPRMDSVLGGQVRLVTHLVIMMEMIQMEMILGRVVVHHSSTSCFAQAESWWYNDGNEDGSWKLNDGNEDCNGETEDDREKEGTSWLGHGEKAPHICSNLAIK